MKEVMRSSRIHRILTISAAAASVCLAHHALAADAYVSGVSLEVGSGEKVHLLRFGTQADWHKRWFEGNGRHLTGYWDFSLAQWRGTAYEGVAGQHRNITSVGITPVLRYQADNGKGWYVEGGIGANLLSHVYNNGGKQLSTAFEFGDHVGAGYIFDNKWDLGLKLQHFSNASIKEPNDGVNFVVLRLARRF